MVKILLHDDTQVQSYVAELEQIIVEYEEELEILRLKSPEGVQKLDNYRAIIRRAEDVKRQADEKRRKCEDNGLSENYIEANASFETAEYILTGETHHEFKEPPLTVPDWVREHNANPNNH